MDLSKSNFDFLGKRRIALIVSSLLLATSIASLAINGLRLGIDFTGGTVLEVGYEQTVELPEIRNILETANLGDASVQHFGTSKEVLIRLPLKEGVSTADLSTQVMVRARLATIPNIL